LSMLSVYCSSYYRFSTLLSNGPLYSCVFEVLAPSFRYVDDVARQRRRLSHGDSSRGLLDHCEKLRLIGEVPVQCGHDVPAVVHGDRKSTRLNSSHQIISY